MAFGFQLLNNVDANIVKIDENSPQLLLYASGTGTTGSINFPFASSLGIVNVPHNNTYTYYSRALMFFRINTPGAYVNFGVPYVSGADYTNTLSASAAGVSFSWRLYLVATPFANSTSGAGLEVYDASSRLVYSSNYRPMNLMYCPNLTVGIGATISHSAPPFGSPWIAQADTIWTDYIWNGTYNLYNIYYWGVAMGTNSWTMNRFLMLTSNMGITPANGGYARTVIGQNKRFFIGYDL